MLWLPAQVVVAIEVSGAVVGSDQQVQVAVAIEVAIRKATTDFGTVELSASLGRDLAENSLAAVEEQLRRLCVSDIAANVANRFVDVPIGNGEVEPSVEVDIKKRAAEAEAVSGCDTYSRLGCDIFKAFAAHAIKADHLVVEVRDGDSRRAGVVEISDVDAHAGARFAFAAEGNAYLDCSVFECTVVLVAVKLVRLGVIGDEEIRPAVSIFIQ